MLLNIFNNISPNSKLKVLRKNININIDLISNLCYYKHIAYFCPQQILCKHESARYVGIASRCE